MYFDYIKNDYLDKSESEREEYIERDKKHLASIIREYIANDIENIVERWYQLDDIGYIQVNEKFLYLLKEAERLYSFGYYTGTIAIIGIAAEEFCKFLMNENNINDVDTQYERIETLEKESIIQESMKCKLHEVRKIRNDCMHYNNKFKALDDNQLNDNAYKMIQMYKSSLSLVSSKVSLKKENVAVELLKDRKMLFNEFKYRCRNIQRKEYGIDMQISPSTSHKIVTSKYYICELDIENELFKEMTILDMYNPVIPIVVDLTLPQVDMINNKKIQEENVIVASVISKVTTLGQTEEFTLLNIHDVFHVCIPRDDLDKYLG